MWSKYDSTGLPIAGSGPGYQFTSITYILNGTTTYTTPAGCRALIARNFAAGGAGGGVSTAASYAAGGGGGGGQYATKLIANPAASYACSVGAGGTQGTAGNNAGNVGSDAVFGASLCVAKGGLGGLPDTGTLVGHIGGIGGDVTPTASSVGDLIVMGQPGGAGVIAAASQALGGFGGMSALGFGAGAIGKKNTGADGNTGNLYGGGGSGGAFIVSGTNRAGGAGANGLIIVEEYA